MRYQSFMIVTDSNTKPNNKKLSFDENFTVFLGTIVLLFSVRRQPSGASGRGFGLMCSHASQMRSAGAPG
jgi:hypothetical protein